MQFADILLRRGLLMPHQLEQAQASNGKAANVLESAADLGFLDRAEALRAPVLDTQTRTKLLDAIKRHRAL